jgi:drug/metabolite transporter (DMT)-like permease
VKQRSATIGSSPSGVIDWKVALTAFCLSVFWGGNIVAIKVSLAAFSPLWNAFWRLLVALPILYGWTRARGVSAMPGPGELRQFCILGAVFIVQITLLNFGIHFTSAAYAVVLMNSHPIFTNVVAHFFVSDDRITPLRVLGLTVAFAGICAALLGEPDGRMASRPVLGNVISIITALSFAVRMIYTQHLVRYTDPARTIFWQTIVAIPVFGLAALLFEPYPILPIGWVPLMALFYQGTIAGGLAFMVWAKLLQRAPAGALSVHAFPTPIFGVLFSTWFFSEAIPPALVIGVTGVVAGIVVVTLESKLEDRIRKSSKLSGHGV